MDILKARLILYATLLLGCDYNKGPTSFT